MEESKPIEVDRVEKEEVQKISNKRKVWEVIKYLVYWTGFTLENNTWKIKKNLKNTKEVVVKFEGRMSTEIRW